MHSDVRRLNKATEGSSRPVDGSFMTAASPGVVALFQVPIKIIIATSKFIIPYMSFKGVFLKSLSPFYFIDKQILQDS